jgi:hypothetical protein
VPPVCYRVIVVIGAAERVRQAEAGGCDGVVKGGNSALQQAGFKVSQLVSASEKAMTKRRREQPHDVGSTFAMAFASSANQRRD